MGIDSVGSNVGITDRLTTSTAATTALVLFGKVALVGTLATLVAACWTPTQLVYCAAVAARTGGDV